MGSERGDPRVEAAAGPEFTLVPGHGAAGALARQLGAWLSELGLCLFLSRSWEEVGSVLIKSHPELMTDQAVIEVFAQRERLKTS